MAEAPQVSANAMNKPTQKLPEILDELRYRKAHEIARELLAGPDVILVIPWPVFHMPGCAHALPVDLRPDDVEGVPCIIIYPLAI